MLHSWLQSTNGDWLLQLPFDPAVLLTIHAALVFLAESHTSCLSSSLSSVLLTPAFCLTGWRFESGFGIFATSMKDLGNHGNGALFVVLQCSLKSLMNKIFFMTNIFCLVMWQKPNVLCWCNCQAFTWHKWQWYADSFSVNYVKFINFCKHIVQQMCLA